MKISNFKINKQNINPVDYYMKNYAPDCIATRQTEFNNLIDKFTDMEKALFPNPKSDKKNEIETMLKSVNEAMEFVANEEYYLQDNSPDSILENLIFTKSLLEKEIEIIGSGD
jgi:hypothetical protein